MSMNLHSNARDLIQTPTDVSYELYQDENGNTRSNEEIINRYIAWLQTRDWANDAYGQNLITQHRDSLVGALNRGTLEFWVS